MRVAIAQVNPTVGALAENRKLVERAADDAVDAGADLVVLPEMVLTGYPPMDLLERDGFVRDQLRELESLEAKSKKVAIVLGAVLPSPEGRPKQLANAAVLLAGGERLAVQPKTLLPTYDVFDENRYFAAGEKREPVRLPGQDATMGLCVCEDTWVEMLPYAENPVEDLARAGATLILNPSASPWHVSKPSARREMLSRLAAQHDVPILFVNQVGGNDELVFDGSSFVIDPKGRVHAQLPMFEPGFAVVDLPLDGEGLEPDDPTPVAQLEGALVLGIRDYFTKQGLPPGAVIQVSGGIDSAVTAHLAVEALGADRVLGIALPGPFSSEHSVDDALALGRNLGIEVRVVGEDGAVLGEREVGVLHLRGESVTPGYLTVDGPLAAQDADGWLDTGDEGYLAGGEVVVCGRRKDVIIMGGRNIYPTDIERAASGAADVRAGNTVAVRMLAGAEGSRHRETFQVVVESRKAGDPAAEQAIRKDVTARVVSAVGVRPAEVVVLGPGSLPKTPSGKLRRSATGDLLRARV